MYRLALAALAATTALFVTTANAQVDFSKIESTYSRLQPLFGPVSAWTERAPRETANAVTTAAHSMRRFMDPPASIVRCADARCAVCSSQGVRRWKLDHTSFANRRP